MLKVMKNMNNGKKNIKMKKIKRKLLELWDDKISITFTIALFTLVIQATGVIVGIVGLVVGAGVSVATAVNANNARKDDEAERDRQQRLQDALVENRQDIPDPYANIKDLSHMIKNPYANLSVATQAAQMQAEEADIALANTLDNLRASGTGAGGATALAQAALRSKKGVSASIQQQEAQNERLKAQGEAQANQQRMAEKQRIQGAAVSGELFQFGAQETREVAELDRSQGLVDQASASALANEQAMWGAIGNLGSGVSSGMGNIATSKMGQSSGNTNTYNTTNTLYNDTGGENQKNTQKETQEDIERKIQEDIRLENAKG